MLTGKIYRNKPLELECALHPEYNSLKRVFLFKLRSSLADNLCKHIPLTFQSERTSFNRDSVMNGEALDNMYSVTNEK